MTSDNKIKQLQCLADKDHLKNISKILGHNFWCDDEGFFFAKMYYKLVVEKMDLDNRPDIYVKYQNKLLEIVG